MMQNLQGRFKMEFPHYNCFPTITKLIVGLYALHAFVVILKVRNLNVFYLSSFRVQ